MDIGKLKGQISDNVLVKLQNRQILLLAISVYLLYLVETVFNKWRYIMDYCVRQIIQFPYYFTPEGWELCDGKRLK